MQLLKHTPIKTRFAGDSQVLCDDSIKALAKFQKIIHLKHEFLVHHNNCEVFSIVSDDERFLVMGYDSEEDVKQKEGFFLGGEGRYLNALEIKRKANYFEVKIFNSDSEGVDY